MSINTLEQRLKEKAKKKILAGLMILVLPITGFVGLMFMFMMFMSGGLSTSMFPDVEEDLKTEFQRVATYCDVSWEEMIAYLTVKYENNFEGLEPEVLTLDFMIVEYDKYEEKVTTTTKYIVLNDDGMPEYRSSGGYKTVSKEAIDSGRYTGDYKAVTSSNSDWEYEDTYYLETASSIKKFASDTGSSSTLATGIYDHLKTLSDTDEYEVRFSSKEVRDFFDELTEEQIEWYNALASANVIQITLGTYYDLPNEIIVETQGFFAWPAPGITRITSNFGLRNDPVYTGQAYHHGLDLAQAGCEGDPVIAMADGRVVNVQYKTTGYGYNVTLEHVDDDGNVWLTRYAHLNQIEVDINEGVTRGTVIGAIGNTGKSTGPHLHFEIRYEGTPVDPLLFVSP